MAYKGLWLQLSNLGACGTEYLFASRWIGRCVNWKNAAISLGTVMISTVSAQVVVSTFVNEGALTLQLGLGGIVLIGGTALGYFIFKLEAASKILQRVRSLFTRTTASSPNTQ